VEAPAARRNRELAAEGVCVVPIGGTPGVEQVLLATGGAANART
jgi:hypothetical protein